MVRFLINIPEELREILREHAKPKGQTINGLIRQILWDWVENGRKGMG